MNRGYEHVSLVYSPTCYPRHSSFDACCTSIHRSQIRLRKCVYGQDHRTGSDSDSDYAAAVARIRTVVGLRVDLGSSSGITLPRGWAAELLAPVGRLVGVAAFASERS